MAKQQLPEHPQVAFTAADQAERAKTKQPPAPHPAMAMANALGTEPHQLDREAVAEYRAGHPKKAASAQAAAAESKD
jgi:hypothetical protein